MKKQRTLLSLIVFLSVFSLSVFLDLQGLFPLTQSSHTNADEALALENDNFSNEPEADMIIPFSYNSSLITGLYNDQEENNRYPSAATPKDSASEEPSDRTNNKPEENPINQAVESASNEALIDTESNIQSASVPAESKLNRTSVETSNEQIEEPKETKSQYSNIGISIAKSYVNIREKATTDSLVLGKLYRDSAAEVLDEVDGWYSVESGSVKGYLKKDYLKLGIPDDELVATYGELRIAVQVDGLNVREEPNTESNRLTVIYLNEIYSVADLTEDWIKIDISDDNIIGYIKREFAELKVTFHNAISKKEEEELLKLQEEERIKKETEVKYRNEVDYSADDLKLLACLVHAESGNQTYEGKLAVANIVLNRVKSSKYASTIKKVIYQSGQFTVASSGSLAKQLSNYDSYSTKSQQLTIKAAKAALEGANNIGTRLYFHSYKVAVAKGYDKKSNAVKIDDQLYW